MRAFVHGIAFSEISAGVQGPGEGVYASHMAAIGVLPAFLPSGSHFKPPQTTRFWGGSTDLCQPPFLILPKQTCRSSLSMGVLLSPVVPLFIISASCCQFQSYVRSGGFVRSMVGVMVYLVPPTLTSPPCLKFSGLFWVRLRSVRVMSQGETKIYWPVASCVDQAKHGVTLIRADVRIFWPFEWERHLVDVSAKVADFSSCETSRLLQKVC